MLTTEQIKFSTGEDEFQVFCEVDRGHQIEGWVQTDNQTSLYYKGFDVVFWEEQQFLLIVNMDGDIYYRGYCHSLLAFNLLCFGIIQTGIYNEINLGHWDEWPELQSLVLGLRDAKDVY